MQTNPETSNIASAKRLRKKKTAKADEVDPLVQKLFLNKLRKTGVALTGYQLLDAAKRRKLNVPNLTAALRFIREDVPELVGFAGGPTKPKQTQFQTIGVSKPGVFFVDYGEFKKRWSGSNKGCTGFLLGVENLTNRLFVEATKGKDTNQWLSSIAKFLERTGGVKLVYSDRDSVAKSEKFRDRLEKRYGIKWRFLAKDNKSYLAESLIGFVKRKLGQGLRARPDSTKKWTDLLQPICDAYNDQIVPGTKYRRGGINETNFDSFVGQLFGDSDPSLSRYNSFKAGPFENERWNRAIFKFSPGDKVSLLKSAIWKKEARSEGTKGFFSKNSSEGGFSKRTYTVAGRQLRANRDFTRMVPVYSLKELGSRHLNYYEPQMRRVGKWANEKNERPAYSVLADPGVEDPSEVE